MQIGRLEEIDKSQMEHVEKISKIQEVDEHPKVNPDDQYKNQQPLDQELKKNEVILNNVQFGYDKEAKQFFIKIKKSGIDYQFPAEDIIKLKAKMQELLQEDIKGE